MSAELRSHGVKEREVIARSCLEIRFAIVGNEDGLVRRIGAGQHQETIPVAGTAWLNPSGVGDDVLSITAPIPKVMHLSLPTTLFSRLSDDFDLPKDPAYSVRYAAVRDEVIASIVRSILSDMTTETSVGRMHAETASLMLAAHIVSRYCDSGSRRPTGPTSRQLDQVRMRLVLDYVSEHLADEITLADLARVAGLSTFHFARMFAGALGLPPQRYLSRLRLEKAMVEIEAGKLSLSQIAFISGFSSQGSFARAFRRATGLTPGQFRRHRR